MANIHQINDYEMGRPIQGQDQSVPNNLWDSMTRVFCPKFSIKTITFAIICLNVALFLILGLISLVSSIGYTCVLYKAGALYPPDIKNFQIHRLIMPAFLHFDIMHIATNTISLFFLSFEPETTMGRNKFTVLYFGSSVYGFILSCLASPYTLTAGASAAIMGLFGYMIVRMLFKIQQMDTKQYGIFLALLALNLFFLFTSPTGNAFAHLGGLIFGALYTLYESPATSAEYPNIEKWKLWALYAISAYPILVLGGFMLRTVVSAPIC